MQIHYTEMKTEEVLLPNNKLQFYVSVSKSNFKIWWHLVEQTRQKWNIIFKYVLINV